MLALIIAFLWMFGLLWLTDSMPFAVIATVAPIGTYYLIALLVAKSTARRWKRRNPQLP